MLSDVQELSLMLDYESGKFSKAQLLNRYCITAKELDDRVRRGKWRVSDKVRGKEDVLERIVEGAGELARRRGIAGSNLKLPKEMTANMQVVAGLEGLSVIEFVMGIYKDLLEIVRSQIDLSKTSGIELNLDMRKLGFKSLGEFTDVLMEMLKIRLEHIKEIPNVSDADEFENTVSAAISEIKMGVSSFQRKELPSVVYKENRGGSKVSLMNADDVVADSRSSSAVHQGGQVIV